MISRWLGLLLLVLWAGFLGIVFVAEGGEVVAEDGEVVSGYNFFNYPFADVCHEYLYFHVAPCPEGYGRVVVNTPTSDRKDGCKESYGVIIECGRVIESEEE